MLLNYWKRFIKYLKIYEFCIIELIIFISLNWWYIRLCTNYRRCKKIIKNKFIDIWFMRINRRNNSNDGNKNIR